MAIPPDNRTTDARSGTVRDESARADDATLRPNARADVRETEMKAHRGGPTLWIVLAVVAALILGFYLFSGTFATAPGPDTGVQVAPADAVGGAVTTTDPEVVVVPGDDAVIDDATPVPAEPADAAGIDDAAPEAAAPEGDVPVDGTVPDAVLPAPVN